MNESEKNRTAGQVKYLWELGSPLGRIVATILLLFLGPLGWLFILILWGFHFLKSKD